jgi:transposase
MHSEEVKKIVREKSICNQSVSTIAKDLGLPRSSIYSIIKSNYKKRSGPLGRPMVMTHKDKKCLREAVRKIKSDGRRVTARKVLSQTRLKKNIRTIQRNLVKCNLRYRKITQKIALTEKHKENRLKIIKRWIFEGISFKNVIFIDEKKFNLDGPDNYCSWVGNNEYPRRNKRHSGGGGVMVYGCVGFDGYLRIERISGKINGQKYVIMLEKLICDLNARNKPYIIAQDNSPVHNCNTTRAFLEENNIKILEWPPRSPDLNLMENIWQMISEKVYNRPQFKSLDDLWGAILESVQVIQTVETEIIKKLYHSIPDRIQTIMIKKGDICN